MWSKEPTQWSQTPDSKEPYVKNELWFLKNREHLMLLPAGVPYLTAFPFLSSSGGIEEEEKAVEKVNQNNLTFSRGALRHGRSNFLHRQTTEGLLGFSENYKDPQLSIYNSKFSPTKFLNTIHVDASYEKLKSCAKTLESSIIKQELELKGLVKHNFDRFVYCKDTIDHIYENLQSRQSNSQTTKILAQKFANLFQDAQNIYGSVLQRTKDVRMKSTAHELLKRYGFLFQLHSRIVINLQLRKYDLIVRDYRRFCFEFSSDTSTNTKSSSKNYSLRNIPIFQQGILGVEKVIGHTRNVLFSLLRARPFTYDPSNSTCHPNISSSLTLKELEKVFEWLKKLDAKKDPLMYYFHSFQKYTRQQMDAVFPQDLRNITQILANDAGENTKSSSSAESAISPRMKNITFKPSKIKTQSYENRLHSIIDHSEMCLSHMSNILIENVGYFYSNASHFCIFPETTRLYSDTESSFSNHSPVKRRTRGTRRRATHVAAPPKPGVDLLLDSPPQDPMHSSSTSSTTSTPTLMETLFNQTVSEMHIPQPPPHQLPQPQSPQLQHTTQDSSQTSSIGIPQIFRRSQPNLEYNVPLEVLSKSLSDVIDHYCDIIQSFIFTLISNDSTHSLLSHLSQKSFSNLFKPVSKNMPSTQKITSNQWKHYPADVNNFLSFFPQLGALGKGKSARILHNILVNYLFYLEKRGKSTFESNESNPQDSTHVSILNVCQKVFTLSVTHCRNYQIPILFIALLPNAVITLQKTLDALIQLGLPPKSFERFQDLLSVLWRLWIAYSCTSFSVLIRKIHRLETWKTRKIRDTPHQMFIDYRNSKLFGSGTNSSKKLKGRSRISSIIDPLSPGPDLLLNQTSLSPKSVIWTISDVPTFFYELFTEFFKTVGESTPRSVFFDKNSSIQLSYPLSLYFQFLLGEFSLYFEKFQHGTYYESGDDSDDSEDDEYPSPRSFKSGKSTISEKSTPLFSQSSSNATTITETDDSLLETKSSVSHDSKESGTSYMPESKTKQVFEAGYVSLNSSVPLWSLNQDTDNRLVLLLNNAAFTQQCLIGKLFHYFDSLFPHQQILNSTSLFSSAIEKYENVFNLVIQRVLLTFSIPFSQIINSGIISESIDPAIFQQILLDVNPNPDILHLKTSINQNLPIPLHVYGIRRYTSLLVVYLVQVLDQLELYSELYRETLLEHLINRQFSLLHQIVIKRIQQAKIAKNVLNISQSERFSVLPFIERVQLFIEINFLQRMYSKSVSKESRNTIRTLFDCLGRHDDPQLAMVEIQEYILASVEFSLSRHSLLVSAFR